MFSTDRELARSRRLRYLFKPNANDDTSNDRFALCCQVLKKEPVWKLVCDAPPWPNPRTSRGMPGHPCEGAEVTHHQKKMKRLLLLFWQRSQLLFVLQLRFTRSLLHGATKNSSRLEESEEWAEQSQVTGSQVRSVEEEPVAGKLAHTSAGLWDRKCWASIRRKPKL